MKWSHFDTWYVKAASVIAISAALTWMAYEVRDHYSRLHACNCAVPWEYFPFIVSGFAIAFFSTILSRRATTAAVGALLPVLGRIRIGGAVSSTTTVTPATPGKPAKLVQTTVVPMTTDVAGTEFDEEAGK